MWREIVKNRKAHRINWGSRAPTQASRHTPDAVIRWMLHVSVFNHGKSGREGRTLSLDDILSTVQAPLCHAAVGRVAVQGMGRRGKDVAVAC